jgi:hypothetical protein
MSLDLSQRGLEKYSNIKFHQSPSSGSRVVPCGQTDGRLDRHEEENNIFSQFCEHVYKLRTRKMSNYAGRHSCSYKQYLNQLLVFMFCAVIFTHFNTNYVNFGNVGKLSCMFNYSMYFKIKVEQGPV